MNSDASSKASSLLSALDNSYVAAGAPSNTLTNTTPIEQISFQLESNFDEGSSQSMERAANAAQMQKFLDNAAIGEIVSVSAKNLSVEESAVPIRRLPAVHDQAPCGGFSLNYDSHTPLRAIDFGGPDQEQRMGEFFAKSIDNISHGLTVKKAMESLGLKEMIAKEESSDRGGILADDMGLGKTVQMIATMVKNQASLDEEHRTTLIVVPAALLNQADSYPAEQKISQIKQYDVVVTTYQTLNQDFYIPEDIESSEETDWLANHGYDYSSMLDDLPVTDISDVSGILARAKFYRAVADEAQATRSSISLAHVQAKYRWMLTGTPVTNTLADIYGLLRFGRFRPWNDWIRFEEHIAKVQYSDAPLAGSRAQAILSPILLRRTKNSMLEGKPILELPNKDIQIVKLEFSRDERDLYDSFEKRTKIRLNRFIRERTLVENQAAVLVMILRLRQLCCHPNLILSQTEEYDDPTLLVGSDSDKEIARAKKVMGDAWVAEVKKRSLLRRRASELLDFSDETEAAEECCPVCQECITFHSVVDALTLIMLGQSLRTTMGVSSAVLTKFVSNSAIAHDGIFGQGNEKENLRAEKEYETGAAKGYRPCPKCSKMTDLTSSKVFKVSAFEPTDEELTKHARDTRRSKRSHRGSNWEVKPRSPSPKASFDDCRPDDSDDDLPDVSTILDKRPVKRQKKSHIIDDDDDVVDLTIDQVTKPLKDTKMSSTSDSEIEIDPIDKKTPRDASVSPNGKEKRKSTPKKRERDGKGGQLDAVIATWSRGDDGLEPSAKMIALIDLLQEWDATGDKTIVYSQ
ncbi:hypothetical protein C0993_007214, partial [Termitomyces sp. T159_Od127]